MSDPHFKYDTDSRKSILAYRTERHPKGMKKLAIIPDGQPIPAGVILGKGCVLKVFNNKYEADEYYRNLTMGLI